MEEPIYSHHQRALWLWILVGLLLGGCALHWMASHNLFVLLFIPCLAALLGILFSGLRTQVNSSHLKLSFGLGVIQKTIPRSKIFQAEAVRNSWWYGWGIRFTPHGWMWNISGLSAIQITYLNGKTFRIGTDDPDGLLIALSPCLLELA